jgi:hypothetical protein
MTKNVLRFNVVHYMKNMMLSGHKRALPVVTFSCFSSLSHLLDDEPHHTASRSC